jgi:two-component system chemotaxis sensor kinase CheA
VLELVRLGEDDAHHRIELIHGAPVYRLRGRLLPLVHLRRELAQPEPDATAAGRAVNIVVLQTDDREFGMVVEGVSDSAEIVVKPLGQHLKNIPAYAGATIMGDGQVALILDVMGLAEGAELLHETARRAMAEATAQADAEAARQADRQALLLLSTADGGRMAIPLSAVDRLEKFPLASVEGIGSQDVVQYRDVILPLIYVNQVLPDRGMGGYSEDEGPAASIHVVVHERNGRRVGIVVDRILDIVDEVVRLDQPARMGVLGSIVIDGRVTEVLDVPTLLESAGIGEREYTELGV